MFCPFLLLFQFLLVVPLFLDFWVFLLCSYQYFLLFSLFLAGFFSYLLGFGPSWSLAGRRDLKNQPDFLPQTAAGCKCHMLCCWEKGLQRTAANNLRLGSVCPLLLLPVMRETIEHINFLDIRLFWPQPRLIESSWALYASFPGKESQKVTHGDSFWRSLGSKKRFPKGPLLQTSN